MRILSIGTALVLILLAAFGCSREREPRNQKPRENVLKTYVKEPLDKAHAVNKQMEERNRRMKEALGE